MWTFSTLSVYIKKVLGLPPVYLLRKENTFTHWHRCSNAALHHTATFVRDKCISSTPHKLKWERFIIWIEAKQFKYLSLTPHTNCVTTFHACVMPSFADSPVLNWLHFFCSSVTQKFQAGIFKCLTFEIPGPDLSEAQSLQFPLKFRKTRRYMVSPCKFKIIIFFQNSCCLHVIHVML